jgi:hypothetical protein
VRLWLAVVVAGAVMPLTVFTDSHSVGMIPLVNPIVGNEGFLVMVEGDAELVRNESEGPIAIGGDLVADGLYHVAVHNPGTFIVPGDTRPSALVVNGSIDFGDSSPFGIVRVLNDGYVKIGDLGGAEVSSVDQNEAPALTQITSDASRDTTPRIELSVSQPEDSVGPVQVIDFDAVFDQFRERSTGLAACPNDVTLLDGNEIPFPDQDAIPPGQHCQDPLDAGGSECAEHQLGDPQPHFHAHVPEFAVRRHSVADQRRHERRR